MSKCTTSRRGGRKASAASLLLLLTGCLAPPALEISRDDPGFTLPPCPVIVVYIDGLHPGIFAEEMAAGRLPGIRRYIAERGAAVENAVACVPTITYANAVSMVTGRFPGQHGILNRWFDRTLYVARNYESAATMVKANLDLAVPTIYQLLEDKVTAVIGMQVHPGAHLRFVVSSDTGGLPAGIAWELGMVRKINEIMADSFSTLAGECRRIGQWPDFLLVYFPAPDEVGHTHGPRSKEYRDSLRDVDGRLGNVLAELDRAGLLEKMTVVLTSDHGMHAVPRDNYVHLEQVFEDELGVAPFLAETERDAEEPYADRVTAFRPWPVILTRSGERTAFVHVRAGPEWSRRPTIEEILACSGDGGKGGSAPERLLRSPAIGFVALRDGDGGAQIYARVGTAAIRRGQTGLEREYAYRVLAGTDPLGYDRDPAARALADGELHPSSAWLDATAALDHPDVVPQLGELFSSRRIGDMVLFAAPGWDFSPDYAGGHGGLERDEMVVPILVAGPGIPAGRRIHAGRLVDLVPTILDLMGLSEAAARETAIDGRSLVSELRPNGKD